MKNNQPAKQPDKLTPSDIKTEEIVLGGILSDSKIYPSIQHILNHDDFYKEEHSMVYRAIVELAKSFSPIDIITVTAKLRSMGLLELVGGFLFVNSLTHRISSGANTEFHSLIIKEFSMKRKLIKIAHEMIRASSEETNFSLDIINHVNIELSKPSFSISQSDPRPKTRFEKARTEITNAQLGIIPGIKTGIKDLDAINNGWQPSDLIILAARPGMGKTAFAISTAKAANRSGAKVGMIELEMSDTQIAIREISELTGYTGSKLKSGNLNILEEKTILTAIDKLINDNYFIDTDALVDAKILKSKIIRLVNEFGCELVVVDYLQLVDDNSGKAQNVNNAIAAITKMLKQTAKQLNIPIIVLSQLSRAVELRSSKRPQLSDLRDSGAIEQDADIVLFLYRPEYYDIKELDLDGTIISSEGMVEIIVSKNRHGALKSVYCPCDVSLNRFGDSVVINHNRIFNLGSAITQNEPF